MILAWGKFISILVLVYVFGTRALKSADIIAEKKKLARAFMGVVFVSMITSFPELFTGISAASLVKSPDIAVGQIIGSCIFNLFIIAIIELFFRKKNLYQLKGKINILPLGFSLILVALLTLAISARFKFSFLNIGIPSILIFVFYFIFLWIIFKERKVEKQRDLYEKKSLKKEIISFSISAIIIIGLGIYLPFVGKEIAEIMRWKESFIGVIFLALVTSFPELVVSVSAAKLGAFEIILGNIAGSNLFNVAIIFFIDLFYVKGAILGSVSRNNISVGLIAILMNFIVFFAVIRQSKYKFLNVISLNGIILTGLYILNLFVSF